MNRAAYHSVYLNPVRSEPTMRWSGQGSVAMVHDIMAGPLPTEYGDCDLLYADLPWRAGFDRYNERAGIADGRTYRQFIARVGDEVGRATGPVVLVAGRHALRFLPKPAATLPIRLPASDHAIALTYNLALSPLWGDTAGLLAFLATGFERVGDFCCGYGWSSRAFTRAGKTFVASDHNAECVGYISAHARGWADERVARPPESSRGRR
jgi:hypothetical protein